MDLLKFSYFCTATFSLWNSEPIFLPTVEKYRSGLYWSIGNCSTVCSWAVAKESESMNVLPWHYKLLCASWNVLTGREDCTNGWNILVFSDFFFLSCAFVLKTYRGWQYCMNCNSLVFSHTGISAAFGHLIVLYWLNNPKCTQDCR